MPTLDFPHVNIALDVFALIISLIILIACVSEYSKKKVGSKHFLAFQFFVFIALTADIVSWFGEGDPAFATMVMIAKTVMACARRVAIIEFMKYLVASLYSNSRASRAILYVFYVLCALSVAFCIGNVFFEYVYYVSEDGHYLHTENNAMGILYLLFPVLSVFAIVLMSFLAKSTSSINRISFLLYTVFPAVGVVLDYTFHGISFASVGFVVTVVAIYTTIYMKRQEELEAQKNALMLSQINPHFVYNTLSTIAAMCDTSPRQAKNLTIDFSQYLRRNIDTLTSEELIPFDREMEHVECYLKIEKARFMDRLNVIYSLDCKDFSIPPLTLQPIVENAIKHGITKKANGGTLKICTHEEDRYYVIDVIDDGAGFDTENAEMHVGIQNVKSRVASTCKGELTIKSTVGVGTRVTIEIPTKKGKRR